MKTNRFALATLAGLLASCQPAFPAQGPQLSPAVTQDASGWTQQGTAAYLAGETSEAIDCFRNAVATDPGRPEAHYHLGVALEAGGQTSAARQAYAESLKLDASSAQARLSMAGLLASSGQTAQAEKQLRTAIGLNPLDAGLHHSLGILLLSQGKAAPAAAEFGKALQINPRHAPAQLGQGKAWFASGRRAEGERAMQEAADDLDTEGVQAFDATVAAWSGAPAARPESPAASKLETGFGAIAIEPQTVGTQSNAALNERGVDLIGRGEFGKALGMLTLAVERAPGDTVYVNNLACAQAGLGYTDLSRALFDTVARSTGRAADVARKNAAWMSASAGQTPSIVVEDGLAVLK